MIRLVWKSSPPNGGVEVGNTSPFVGSVSGGALPALSCQVWKCMVSVGPMLSRMRKHLGAGDPLRERRVEAGAALLDEGEVEAGRVGDRLEVVGRGEVVVASGNRRKLPGS